ncbi:uncharacterized protein LOC113273380 [Papaver somniferum]|uniref:uncharacterized protein LOC113273380 n=1 Tax=Papaver somniferum TaxID=3469 RepID=UPI000E6F53FF|nr:uncharacterized protein LOC113273380 [Papaver somniferum]
MNHMIIHNYVNGGKGNICLFWSDSITTPTVVSITKQVITVDVGGVLVLGVHADSLSVDRRELWMELDRISFLNLPWLVIGDFNIVLSIEEKKGGRSPLGVAMQDFHDCINACCLIEAPKTGRHFTWCNNRAGSKRIVCTLDRALYDMKWLETYPEWCYKVGVRGVSDHIPLLCSVLNIQKPKNITFRVLKVWLEEESFKKVIQDVWNEEIYGNPAYIFMNKMKLMKIKIREWNWNVFGDVRVKMQEAEKEVMKAALLSDNEPDPNTIANYLEKHFEDKFKIKGVDFAEGIIDAIPGVITEADTMVLEVVPSAKEIKEAVFDLNADSAPGPDGFPGFFYRFAWDILGEGVIRAIQYCWSNGFIPWGMNSNFLFLIPKVKCARKPNQYRPIGLSNFSFKIFTKIITSRMYGLLEKVVSSQQGAFVKGRCIQGKIMLASEMVNEMDIKRRGGNVGLKLDIAQAYDSLSWEFLWEVMRRFGFSAKCISWLHTMFMSAKISVLVNGGPIGFFSVSRGLRQGDPLSPILFVIAEDVLSRSLSKLVQEKKISPMVNRGGAQPTHILFVDDVFLFFNGHKKNILSVLDFLRDYQVSSGQVINQMKSKVFVGGVTDVRNQQIANEFQMPLSSFPDKYLVYKWPASVIKTCERMMRNFRWTGDPSTRKMVTIKWDKVCAPLEEGGLGLKRLSVINKALLMKLLWMLNSEEEWAVFMRAKKFHSRRRVIKEKALAEIFPDDDYINQNSEMKVFDLICNGEWLIPQIMLEYFTVEVTSDRSQIIWKWLGGMFVFLNSLSYNDIMNWDKPRSIAVQEVWLLDASITMVELWFLRNKIVFEEEKPDLIRIKKRIMQFTKDFAIRIKGEMWECIYDFQVLRNFDLKRRLVRVKKIMELSFYLPAVNQLLVCCAGTSRGEPGNAGLGFVCRDNRGEFVFAE